MSSVKIDVFQKGGAERSNLKPHKHIALHQIHKIMLFLASSYDPFNFWPVVCVDGPLCWLTGTAENEKENAVEQKYSS